MDTAHPRPQLKTPMELLRPLLSHTTHPALRSQCHCPSQFSLDQLFFPRDLATTLRRRHLTSRRHHHPSVPRTGRLHPRRGRPHRSHLTSPLHHHPATSPSRRTSPLHHLPPTSPSLRTSPHHPSRPTSLLSRRPSLPMDPRQPLPSRNTSLPSLSTTHPHPRHRLQLTSPSPPPLFPPTSRTKPGPKLSLTCPRSSASM